MLGRQYEVELGPVAEDDAGRAFRWYLEHNPLHAVEWYDGLVATILSLCVHPERCAKSPEAKRHRRPIRQRLYRRGSTTFRILFVVKVETGVVHVLRIRHGARRPLRKGELAFNDD
jgi:plasmid stabilization system protein ParE